MFRPLPSVIASVLLWGSGAILAAQESRPDVRGALQRLYGEQRYEEMLEIVQPELTNAPGSADLWIMAAEAAFKLDDFERAITSFERGVKLDPRLASVRINLGFAYLKADRLEDARAVFDAFLKDSNRDRAAKAHYGLGLVLSARGDAGGARKAFADSIALDPADARPHYRLGQIALQAGDAASAIVSFTAAMKHDELHYGAAHGLARAYAAAGNVAESARWTERHRKVLEATDAVTNMIRRLAQAPDGAAARVAIGVRLEEADARARAASWYQKALKLDPSNEEARRRLAGIASSLAESRR